MRVGILALRDGEIGPLARRASPTPTRLFDHALTFEDTRRTTSRSTPRSSTSPIASSIMPANEVAAHLAASSFDALEARARKAANRAPEPDPAQVNEHDRVTPEVQARRGGASANGAGAADKGLTITPDDRDHPESRRTIGRPLRAFPRLPGAIIFIEPVRSSSDGSWRATLGNKVAAQSNAIAATTPGIAGPQVRRCRPSRDQRRRAVDQHPASWIRVVILNDRRKHVERRKHSGSDRERPVRVAISSAALRQASPRAAVLLRAVALGLIARPHFAADLPAPVLSAVRGLVARQKEVTARTVRRQCTFTRTRASGGAANGRSGGLAAVAVVRA